MEAIDYQTRLLDLLKAVSCKVRPCRFCGQQLYFVPVASGKMRPYTAEGRNHFEDCPHFQRQTAPQQEALFPAQSEAFD